MKPTPKIAKSGRATRRPFALVLAVAALLALPILAQADHWPNFGGDAGHSGNQPVDVAELPTKFEWTQPDDGTIRNSIITTGGPDAASQFTAYGKTVVVGSTNNDRAEVNLRTLEDGVQKITDQTVRDVDDSGDDPDAFGPTTGRTQGVSFVDSSTNEGPGQLFVVHNDSNQGAKSQNDCMADQPDRKDSENDIAIAQFDIATGAKKSDFSVGQASEPSVPEQCSPTPQVTAGYTIESSPVISPPLGNTGLRWIFFIAKKDAGGSPRLFGVKVDNAGSASAVIESDTPQIRDVADANTLASPTLMYLNTPDQLAGGTTLYVAVPVNGQGGASDIRTFQVGDIGDASEDGPAGGDVPGIPQTISVPVTQTGRIPGQAGSGSTKAPAMYVAYDNDDDTTTVRKFVQQGASATLTPVAVDTAAPVEGNPSTALALSVLAEGTGETDDGRIAVATDKNLILLDSETLTPVDRLADAGETLGAGDAFSRTSPLVSGGLIFITNDDGTQAVLNLSDAEPVGPDFSQNEANQGADRSIGQPSYSSGYLQFLTDRGAFVYRTGIIIPPNEAPTARFTASPNPALVGQAVTFDASATTDPEGKGIARYEWDYDSNGTFDADTGSNPKATHAFPSAGTFTVTLRVTDNPSAEGAFERVNTVTGQVVVNQPPANKPPAVSFTETPNPAKVDQRVTFDASATKDQDGGTITKFEWDLDGNGSFETNSGTNPRVERSYSKAGTYNVKLRATDNGGGSAELTRALKVTKKAGPRPTPKRLTANVTPRRDAALPFVFKTSGKLTRPSGVSRVSGCTGRVTVVVKSGKKTISRRTTALRSNCAYRTSVTFRDRTRMGSATSLRFTARFQGNRALGAKQAKTARVRVG